jgi:membrane-bound lytic murein transglycosylase D
MRTRLLISAILSAGVLTGCQTFDPKEQTAQQEPNRSVVGTLPNPLSAQRSPALHPSALVYSAYLADQYDAKNAQEGNDILKADDLWEITRAHFQLQEVTEHEAVEAQIRWYLKAPGHMRRISQNASRYYYHILNEVLARGLPAEVALIPAVESHFDPDAYSKGHAAGIWQFIPSTAQYFGIKRSRWYDGRRDVLDSTKAALNYLERLNKRFEGDWLLTMAAYNAGGGTVSRAIRKNREAGKPTDFWSLDLPQETRMYVPRILAITAFVNAPDEYDIHLPAIKNTPYFDVVKTKSAVNLKQVAKLSGTHLNELQQLNPGFSEITTDPRGPYRLLVPVKNAPALTAALTGKTSGQLTEWASYTIKSGDSLSTIARKFDSSVAEIKAANDMTSNRLVAGRDLIIPQTGASSSNVADNSDYEAGTISQHVVSTGESLWSVANQYGVTKKQLAQWNNLSEKEGLKIGQKLRIGSLPIAVAQAEAEALKEVGYQVKIGDSLYLIAQRYNVSVRDILAWNNLKNTEVTPGQQITLFVD